MENPAIWLLNDSVSCVVCKNGKVYAEKGIGVKPLLFFLRQNPRFFSGASVADKVIGKAAALLLIYSGVSAVYGEVMSESAIEMLEQYGVPYSYGTLVPVILNRRSDDLCPLEQAVKQIDNPVKALLAVENRVAELMAQKR